ncbi:MAG: bifunctional DNA-formamidopyrimidine glycosylase/DNA-(apurinic or apyrimidinic site) lyase [Candidatus Moranbacteria bacterium]|nr:bifunctional DNA-formamidopyrimidine glycosylase/DNA-(apurinic or apyrimidinic site) lyase [Candidatus Moranbacteria bacterium]
MPELPEVETVVIQLNQKIKGKTINKIWSDHKKMVSSHSFLDFEKLVENFKIKNVKRRGKNIFIESFQSETIWIHLKMTGHLLFKPKNLSSSLKKAFQNDPFNQYIHFIFYFKDESRLEFSDLRKFGRIRFIQAGFNDIIKHPSKYKLDSLGPEPLELTREQFKDLIAAKIKRNQKSADKEIKPLLLDQKFIAGIGNIYASEILFKAGINPRRKVKGLKQKEIDRLFDSVKMVLEKAIKNRGTSTSDFRDTFGQKGKNESDLMVYKRTGKRCRICGNIINRFKQDQRSTFYCPKCQK